VYTSVLCYKKAKHLLNYFRVYLRKRKRTISEEESKQKQRYLKQKKKKNRKSFDRNLTVSGKHEKNGKVMVERTTENIADNKVHFLEKYTRKIISQDKKAGKLLEVTR